MRAITAALLASVVPCAALAQSPIASFPPGVFQPRAAIDAGAAAPAYTGPGDLVSFFNWYGLRAYSSATRGNALINVCNVADVACVDFVSNATTGDLVVTTVGGSSCGVITCTVKILYDQGPNGATCVGSSCPINQATIANRPTLTLNCIGSLPCLTFSSSASLGDNTGGHFPVDYAQPVTYSMIYNRTGGTGAFGDVWGTGGSGFLSNNSANGLILWANNASLGALVTVSDNAFHAVQGIANNTMSTIYVDGSTNSVSVANGANLSPSNGVASTRAFVGQITELGFYIAAMSGGQLSSLNSNQHTYWGF
jgi:hypothetical protein